MSEELQRINCYLCEYGCNTTTVDVDRGVTPFMIQCRSRPRKGRPIEAKYLDAEGFCIGTATSSMYPKLPLPPHLVVAWEWYLPSAEEIAQMPGDHRSYYDGQHLKLRERTDREPLYHEARP